MNKTDAKYTFLLPAFKVTFLQEALLSIKQQTFSIFFVIVSDDCSPENIKEVFDKCVGDDKRFTYRRNNTNIGGKSLVNHWNLLCSMCYTDYLIMASDDDLYAPTFLEEIDRLTLKYPDVNLFRCNVKRIDADGVVTAMDDPCNEYETQIDFLYNLFCRRRLKCIANYVFKTSSICKAGGFVNFPLAWGSDDITVMRESEKGVCNISQPLFFFRLSGLNITTNKSKDKIIKCTKAREMNLLWFDDFIKDVKHDGTSLSINRLNDFKTFYIREWTRNIIESSCFLPWSDFLECYRFLKKRRAITGILEKVHLFWTWIRAQR
ncbi:MAG: glycosyltransferase family 2 protein [Prevotella sp.]|nr:glycosyltransferase family 2 protein [Prevotella sp.]